jgi:hypothetical protein
VEELLRFFSPGWCAEAMYLANRSTDLPEGLKDPGNFTLILAFECTDRPEVASWAQFVAGKVLTWEPGLPEATGAKAVLRAELDTWRSAAEDGEPGTTLLMAGRIKLRDTKNKITYNYAAFDSLLATWAQISTDWADGSPN